MATGKNGSCCCPSSHSLSLAADCRISTDMAGWLRRAAIIGPTDCLLGNFVDSG